MWNGAAVTPAAQCPHYITDAEAETGATRCAPCTLNRRRRDGLISQICAEDEALLQRLAHAGNKAVGVDEGKP